MIPHAVRVGGSHFVPFFPFTLLIYSYLAVLGLCLCGLFSSCSKWGYSLVAMRRLLTAVASLLVELGS